MTHAPKHVCNYAVLRFLPYSTSGEFVNLGIVAHCTERGWFGFEEEPGATDRIMQFFPSVDSVLYEQQRVSFFAELARIRDLIMQTPDRQFGKRVFMELIRPRESAFRFSEVRTIMTDDLATLPLLLCEEYVKPRPMKEQTAMVGA